MPLSFWPPLTCGRQVCRQTNTLALALGTSRRKFCASTEMGHLGTEIPGAYPKAQCKDICRV